ncbi:flagellar basal body rod protein FlgC [Vibrio sp. MEBiC08052]|uniref:flagellar basal body rod protein FlgC n=1 Tax=Vibrio sp. MEBiC08052 TaxID=1761910 RepID=UPI0007408797|nr:flagellar basal body rod C-terminal domain-containing protein [Vibrio sp. MEBiC08052]KUI97022.1 hypothetical protein VRK_38770 [Vibrio sp. MEBiC08052]
MALSEIKAIAAQGLDYQRVLLEAAGLNIANANKTVKPGQSVPLYHVSAQNQTFAEMVSGQDSEPQVIAEVASLKSSYSPSDPTADSHGLVWRPDIDTTQQLIDVTRANRAYEANLRIYNAASSMGKSILQLGNN